MFRNDSTMDWQPDWHVPEWRLQTQKDYKRCALRLPAPGRPRPRPTIQQMPVPALTPLKSNILGKRPREQCDLAGPETWSRPTYIPQIPRTTHVPGSWPVESQPIGVQTNRATASTARQVRDYLKKHAGRAKQAAIACTNVAREMKEFTYICAIPAAAGMKKRIVEESKTASTNVAEWSQRAAMGLIRAIVPPPKAKRTLRGPDSQRIFVKVRQGSELEAVVASRPTKKGWLGTAAAAGRKSHAGISKRKRAKGGFLDYFTRSDASAVHPDPSTLRSQRRAKRSILRKDNERAKAAKKTATFYASPNSGGPVSTVRRFTLPPSSDAAETSEPPSSPMRGCRSIYRSSVGLGLAAYQLATPTMPTAKIAGSRPTNITIASSSTEARKRQSLPAKRDPNMHRDDDANDEGSEDEVDLIDADSSNMPGAFVPSHALTQSPPSHMLPARNSKSSAESLSKNPLRDYPKTDVYDVDDLSPLSSDGERGNDTSIARRLRRRAVFDQALTNLPVPQPRAEVAFPEEPHVISAIIKRHISSSSPKTPKPSVYTRRRSRRILEDNLAKAAASPERPVRAEESSPLKRFRLGSSERRNVNRHEQEQNALNDSLARLQLVSEETTAIEKEEARLAKEKAEAEERERLAEIERERRAHRIAPSQPVIAPLSQEWQQTLAKAMAQPPHKPLATAPNGAKLLRRDLGTLYPQRDSDDSPMGWLNDEIINTSMQHVVTYALRATNHKRGLTPRFHAFASQFFQNISTQGVQSVARWAKRAKIGGEDLLNVDCVFIPCNPGVHWTVIIVMPTRRLVEYFDSMHGSAEYYLDLARDWLSAELGDKFDESEWTFREGIGPTQHNGQDCGVFLVTTSKMVMLGIDPEKAYSEKDLKLQRQRIACEMLNGGFTDDFAPPEKSEAALKMTNGS